MISSPTALPAILKVLLVEDNLGDASLVRYALAEAPGGPFEITHVERLANALAKLSTDSFDVVLLDLGLPDSFGIEGIEKIQKVSKTIPVIILTGYDDKNLALKAVQEGAQDYLSKNQLEARLLSYSIRHSIERKKLQIELDEIRSQQLHNQKVESLGILAGGVAHDFNNLLTVILGNAELGLAALSSDSPARQYLSQIEISSRRGAELCKKMLDFSGKTPFEVRPLDLNAILREMNDLLMVSIRKGAILKQDLTRNLPAIQGDASQIQQMVMNLVINASEAIGDKNGVITLTTGVMQADRAYLTEVFLPPHLPEGEYVFLEVSDTGCGIDPEIRERIFDPFFTTKFTGRGLGLAAVLGIIRGHNGALKVYSQKGKGSTFRVLFPSVPSNEPEKNGPAEKSEGKKVLVVDDDASVRSVTVQMMEMFGFQALTAGNGQEAIEIFKAHSQEIRLVLLDMTMPHMNGEECFRRLRELDTRVPIFLMTGYSEEEAVHRFEGRGLSGFIQKPFKLKEFQEIVRTAIQT